MDAPDIPSKPCGELVTRIIAMPKDTNPNGDIFGGWLMAQMDRGRGMLSLKTAKTRVVTVERWTACRFSSLFGCGTPELVTPGPNRLAKLR